MAKLKTLNIFKTYNAIETIDIAFNFAKGLNGEIILLRGPIGAGKTTFVKGLAKYFKCKRLPISSSFNIMRIYRGKKDIYHYDLFRLRESELDEIGLEFTGDDQIIVIEWPELAKKFYERFGYIDIDIELNKNDERIIKIKVKK